MAYDRQKSERSLIIDNRTLNIPHLQDLIKEKPIDAFLLAKNALFVI